MNRAFAISLLLASCAGHRQPGSLARCVAPEADAVVECSVDLGAFPVMPRAMPLYPPDYLRTGSEVTVTANYVVDAAGVVQSIRTSSPDPDGRLFGALVTDALQRTTYTPAQHAGLPVAVVVQELFTFVGPEEGAPPLPPEMRHLNRASSEPRHYVIGIPMRDLSRTARVSAADSGAIVASAVQSSVSQLEPVVTAICVEAAGGTARGIVVDTTLLRSTGHQITAMEECPPTLRTWIQRLDAMGRPIVVPPEHVDPHRVRVQRLYPWMQHVWTVELEIWQSARGRRFRCALQPENGNWNATCKIVGSMIS